ncbi:MAG: 6-pyruvoyl tetrahydropterin synthase family protein [Planctomycetaceae bacterium]|jgi:6-pyruvoyltetrahydropterin/6-carboxytetrahydropterin synthase
MPETYRVRVSKDHLVFSAAHFVTIGDECERLHGHNWRVAVEVAGPLDENAFVVDFIALRDEMQQIVNQLDHRMLLPMQHRAIHVDVTDDEVEARFHEKRWVFPREDCVLLPANQTTAERLAECISDQLRSRLEGRGVGRIDSLQTEVEENFGQWAIHTWRPTNHD